MILALSQKYGGFRRTAHTDQRGKGRNGENDRCGHADPGKGLFSHLRDVSDEHLVYQVV